MLCENISCGNYFYRMPKDTSPHNYCSSHCAAVVNNRKRPWIGRVCAFPGCVKKFKRENKYCSQECATLGRRGYTKDDLVKDIKVAAKKLSRVPTRREFITLADRCRKVFGSWNNAIIVAGLQPHRSHDNRMYKRMNTKAQDGHICDSISEAIVDNWLFVNKIPHKKDMQYPSTNHKADWVINGGKTFIEYFGLAKDSPRYDRSIKEKENLCRRIGVELIGIYPSDLYPENRLSEKLEYIVKTFS